MHPLRRPHGADRIVLVGVRYSEHGHDGVTCVLFHRAAEDPYLRGHLLEERREERPDRLGIVTRH